MPIENGYKKYKKKEKTENDKYKLISYWTASDAVEITHDIEIEDPDENKVVCNNGVNLEEALKSILAYNENENKKILGLINAPITESNFDKSLLKKLILNEDVDIVYDHAGLLDSTKKIVIVLRNNGLMGDGSMCVFKQSNEWERGGYKRNNDTYVFAIPSSNLTASVVPTTDLGDTIASYYNAPELYYSRNYGLFSNTIYDPETGRKSIGCSGAVCAFVQGITYENSRYERGDEADNLLGNFSGIHVFPPSPDGILSGALKTWELAQFYAEHGCLYEFGDDYEKACAKLRFGDVIFSSDLSESEQNRFYEVAHCGMVLQTFPERGIVLVAQVGRSYTEITSFGVSKTAKISYVDLKNYLGIKYKVFARPVYGGSAPKAESVIKHFSNNVNIINENEVEIARIYPTEIKKGKMYSIALSGILPTGKEDEDMDKCRYLRVRAYFKDGSPTRTFTKQQYCTTNGKNTVIIFSPLDEAKVASLSIQVVSDERIVRIKKENPEENDEEIDESEYTVDYKVDEVGLYHGICSTTNTRPINIENPGSEFDVIYNRSCVIDGVPTFNIRLNRVGEATGDIVVGDITGITISDEYEAIYLTDYVGNTDRLTAYINVKNKLILPITKSFQSTSLVHRIMN